MAKKRRQATCPSTGPRSGKTKNLGKKDGTGRLSGTAACPKTKRKKTKK